MGDVLGRYFLAGCLVFVGMMVILAALAKYPEAFVATAVGIGMAYAGFRVARPNRHARPARRARP